MLRVVHNVPYSELYGTESQFSDIVQGFSQFGLQETVRFLSKLSYVLSVDDNNAYQHAVQHVLSPATLSRLATYAMRMRANLIPFYRQQLLIAMKLSFLSHAKDTGKDLDEPAARYELGDLLLKIADLCPPPPNQSVTRDLIGEPAVANRDLSISILLQNEPDYPQHVARYYKLLFTFIPEALRKKGLPEDLWERRFEAIYRCSLRDVFLLSDLIFACLYVPRQQNYAGQHPWFERQMFIRKLRWDAERIDRTLAHISADWETFPNLILREQSLPFATDFSVFQRKPLIADSQGFQIIDRRFLMGMFGEQLLRQIRTAISVRDQQDHYGGVLGEGFEQYVRWVLRHAFPKSDQLIDRLQQPSNSGGKAPDIEILDTPVHVYIEVKGMLFTDHAIFGSDPQLFALELYRNYAHSTGVKQLANHIAAVQKQGSNGSPARIQPIVLGLDRSLSSFAVQSTLQNAFRGYFEGAGGNINPTAVPMVSRLTVLSAIDLEHIVAVVMDGTRIKDIVDEISSSDPSGMLSAHDVINNSRYQARVQPPFVIEAGEEIRTSVIEMFRLEDIVPSETA